VNADALHRRPVGLAAHPHVSCDYLNMEIEKIKSQVLAFERIIESGLKEKYRNHPQEFRDHLKLMVPLYGIDINAL
jgi:hypothetical protein